MKVSMEFNGIKPHLFHTLRRFAEESDRFPDLLKRHLLRLLSPPGKVTAEGAMPAVS